MAHKLNVLYFLLFLLVGGVGFFLFPKNLISMDEKRKLATIPQFDWKTYTEGSFTDSIDNYIDDHFVFRKELIYSADFVRSLKGFKLEEQERKLKVFKTPLAKANDKTTSGSQKAALGDLAIEGEYHSDLTIIDGRVYSLNGGSPAMSVAFAKMVNDYAAKLSGKCRVFTLVPPLSCAFINDSKYANYNAQSRRTLAAIGSNLSNGAIFGDVFSELNAHKNERLYFGTDHHWNATGAYYAYVAFCKSAGISPVSRESMTKKTKYGFLGSFYQLTRDPEVKEHPDTFAYYIPAVQTKAIAYPADSYLNPRKISVFANASGGNMYSTFITGDNPLTKITTSVKNGKKCVIVKNSMGNALSVYFISHYEEVWVIDFRYSKHNLLSLIKEQDINDLIFGVGMYAAMSHGTIGMMKRFQTHAVMAPKREEPATPQTPLVDTISTPNLPKDSLRIE